MKKILLVQASNEHELSDWNYDGLERFLGKRSNFPPLALATLAGMTPSSYELTIWDEHIHGLLQDGGPLQGYDLVGITAFSSQLSRARKIARLARQRGILVVVGGPGVTAAPQSCREDFDVLFLGEAEITWPQFLADWAAGRPIRNEYQEMGLPDLALSPRPGWDALADVMHNYIFSSVQVSRGCPFHCEFCNVWQTFGRKMRTKPLPHVEAEIRTLEAMGFRAVLLSSDNLVGNHRYARQLLRHLIHLNAQFDAPLHYNAELDISVARNDELLRLLAEANFSTLLIGIETPNRDSLAEARKHQNLRGNLAQNCRHIQSYGVPIDGSMVVGFDHDTPATFDDILDFVQEACIPLPKMHLLKAIPGTELYQRLAAEGRLTDMTSLQRRSSAEYLDPAIYSNILPKAMSRMELFEGYSRLLAQVYHWARFEQRVRGFLEGITRPSAMALRRSATGSRQRFEAKSAAIPAELLGPAEALFSHAERHHPPFAWMVLMLIFRYMVALDRAQAVQKEIDHLLCQEGLTLEKVS
jgi:radical SAM superfamily enzyme YgiQ (UPF0313 family)